MKGYNNNNMNSPNESMLMRYLRSGTPLDHNYSPSLNHSRPIGSSKSSSSSNLDDDVLVMDGILVDSNKASKSSEKFFSSAISDSSSSGSGSNFYRTESCVSWENTGSCRYGHKCQFAHGKEELRPIPNRVRSKKKSDLISSDVYYSPQSSTSSNSSKLGVDTMATPSSAKEAANLKFSKSLPSQVKNTPNLSPNLKIKDWSPLDDGITVQLPSSTDETPSKQAVDEYINSMLYSPAQKTRLPVFVDICPELHSLHF